MKLQSHQLHLFPKIFTCGTMADAQAAAVAAKLAQFEPDLVDDAQIWSKLEHFAQTLPRHSATSLSDAAVREKEAAMVADLLKDVNLPLLFAATNKAHM
jgi:hypothetical protein